MASILDQYVDSLSHAASSQQNRTSLGIPHMGYVNAQWEKETPIFNKQRIDFTPPEKINSLVVSSNQLCMSLGKDILFRLDLAKADEPNQVELGRKDEAKVYKLFLNHTGSHLIIALNTNECLYLNRSAQKLRVLSRWKGHLIGSIGWTNQSAPKANQIASYRLCSSDNSLSCVDFNGPILTMLK